MPLPHGSCPEKPSTVAPTFCLNLRMAPSSPWGETHRYISPQTTKAASETASRVTLNGMAWTEVSWGIAIALPCCSIPLANGIQPHVPEARRPAQRDCSPGPRSVQDGEKADISCSSLIQHSPDVGAQQNGAMEPIGTPDHIHMPPRFPQLRRALAALHCDAEHDAAPPRMPSRTDVPGDHISCFLLH
jgi:hypothetical protein